MNDYEWVDQFPPVKAPSAYEGVYSPRHMKRSRFQDNDSVVIGCGVVAVIALSLALLSLIALVVVG